ncbi:MAG: Uma2 family endonuclease [Anaerolineae bacterium]|nr:Uma2 family endonuclease [Anaerolineae bacterium]
MTDQVKTVTQADLLQLEAEGKKVEVYDGIIVECDPVTHLHVVVIDNLFILLQPFVKTNRLGRVYTDGVRYRLRGGGDDVLDSYIPDFSFIRKERIPQDYDFSGDFPGAPNLAVEVASPGQSTAQLLAKIADYLDAGTEEAWLIFMDAQEIHQYRQDAPGVRIYKGSAEITSPLFPDFKIITESIFVTET